jgi:hypothetical protein
MKPTVTYVHPGMGRDGYYGKWQSNRRLAAFQQSTTAFEMREIIKRSEDNVRYRLTASSDRVNTVP